MRRLAELGICVESATRMKSATQNARYGLVPHAPSKQNQKLSQHGQNLETVPSSRESRMLHTEHRRHDACLSLTCLRAIWWLARRNESACLNDGCSSVRPSRSLSLFRPKQIKKCSVRLSSSNPLRNSSFQMRDLVRKKGVPAMRYVIYSYSTMETLKLIAAARCTGPALGHARSATDTAVPS